MNVAGNVMASVAIVNPVAECPLEEQHSDIEHVVSTTEKAEVTPTSYSVDIGPFDDRCRWWAKLIRAGSALPLPQSITGAESIPGDFLRPGEEELTAGDVLVEGEANHHRRPDRGWRYWVTVVDSEERLLRFASGFGFQKSQMKDKGMHPDLLKGSGDVAGAIRVAHGIRSGLLVVIE